MELVVMLLALVALGTALKRYSPWTFGLAGSILLVIYTIVLAGSILLVIYLELGLLVL